MEINKLNKIWDMIRVGPIEIKINRQFISKSFGNLFWALTIAFNAFDCNQINWMIFSCIPLILWKNFLVLPIRLIRFLTWKIDTKAIDYSFLNFESFPSTFCRCIIALQKNILSKSRRLKPCWRTFIAVVVNFQP